MVIAVTRDRNSCPSPRANWFQRSIGGIAFFCLRSSAHVPALFGFRFGIMLLPITAAPSLLSFSYLALLLLQTAQAQLPAEWQQGVQDCDILFSLDDAFSVVPPNIQATIGNGFIATQMRRYRTPSLPNRPPLLRLPSAALRSSLLEPTTAPLPQTPATAPLSLPPSTSKSKPPTATTEYPLSPPV